MVYSIPRQTLARALGIAKGYRSPHINEVQIENGVIKEVLQTTREYLKLKILIPIELWKQKPMHGAQESQLKSQCKQQYMSNRHR